MTCVPEEGEQERKRETVYFPPKSLHTGAASKHRMKRLHLHKEIYCFARASHAKHSPDLLEGAINKERAATFTPLSPLSSVRKGTKDETERFVCVGGCFLHTLL